MNDTSPKIEATVNERYKSEERGEISVVKDSLTTAADGKRYSTRLYNLDAVVAVGYGVVPPRCAVMEQLRGSGGTAK